MMMANSMFLEAASKIVFAAGKSKTDAIKVRRYPIFVTLSLRVECSPKGSHSILALKNSICSLILLFKARLYQTRELPFAKYNF